ncbi:hypothetical protein MUK42_06027 [Musa troglodytarum]|uniref:Uncharacterized protein n=1 Tax=Musa troglodytarum TaxID=320322 RepID=A0A9E7GZ97_9LILI|nr:hypothetical protein MUK42_06027 [Musa troglodytarum]
MYTLASGNDTKVVVVVVVKWETSLPSRSNWTKNAQKVSVACSSNSKAMAVRINYRRKEGLPATGVITCRRWRKGEESSGERERVHGFVVSSEDSPSCGVAACRYVFSLKEAGSHWGGREGGEEDKAKGSRGKRGPSRKGSFFLEGNVVWLEAVFSFTVVACEEISDQASFPSITASTSTACDPASLMLISSPVVADLQPELPGRLPRSTSSASPSSS